MKKKKVKGKAKDTPVPKTGWITSGGLGNDSGSFSEGEWEKVK